MNEFNEYDQELPGNFLYEEPDDIDFILMPKLDFDLERTIDDYYKLIKRSKNKEQVKEILREFYEYICNVNTIMNDIKYLQDRVKQLELDIKFLSGDS
jgi:hypothetical protein